MNKKIHYRIDSDSIDETQLDAFEQQPTTLVQVTMGISINTNIAATKAGFNLASNQDAMNRSLNRLSSGNRIVQPADDAGGLAVSMKLTSTIKNLRAVTYKCIQRDFFPSGTGRSHQIICRHRIQNGGAQSHALRCHKEYQ